MSVKTHKIASALLGLSLALGAGQAEAKIKTVQVTGEAAEVKGDRAATEAAAKRAARRKAVEEGAGVLVESNTIVRNFQMVSDEIASSAKGVITDEQWGPIKVKDGVASISLTAKVSPDAMEDAICTVVKANHDPRVALVFVERQGKRDEAFKIKSERGMIENAFAEAFQDACFTVVESGVKVSEVAANGDLPQETIDQIVKNSNAQYVVLGKAETITTIPQLSSNATPEERAEMEKRPGMRSYTFSVNLHLLNTETNVIDALASNSVTSLAANDANAIKFFKEDRPVYAKNANKDYIKDERGQKVITGYKRSPRNELMDQLFQKISSKWTSDLVNQSKVIVTVKGIKNFKAAKDFRSGVEGSIQGAKVTQRSLKNGVAIMDIEIEGGADALATAIDQKKFGKETVEVLEVVPGKITLELK